uniref:Uncharacterized protein n=1 Tax=Anopheles darlingi TaxID=43151 RepID=A0A2M4CXC1_ANODA
MAVSGGDTRNFLRNAELAVYCLLSFFCPCRAIAHTYTHAHTHADKVCGSAWHPFPLVSRLRTPSTEGIDYAVKCKTGPGPGMWATTFAPQQSRVLSCSSSSPPAPTCFLLQFSQIKGLPACKGKGRNRPLCMSIEGAQGRGVRFDYVLGRNRSMLWSCGGEGGDCGCCVNGHVDLGRAPRPRPGPWPKKVNASVGGTAMCRKLPT